MLVLSEVYYYYCYYYYYYYYYLTITTECQTIFTDRYWRSIELVRQLLLENFSYKFLRITSRQKVIYLP
jgi:hypothetical protein